MNKTIVIIAAVVILALLGGGAFMMMNRSGVKPSYSKDQELITPTITSMSGKKSLRDFASIGSNQECTYLDVETDSTGVIYIGEGELRGDFETNVDGKMISSHFIQDKKEMYIWSDGGEMQGIKVSLAEAAKATEIVDVSKLDLNKEVDYSCKSWSVQQDFFDAPTNVKFQDYDKLMEGLNDMFKTTTPGVSPGAASCNICDTLSGESRDSCRTALKCN